MIYPLNRWAINRPGIFVPVFFLSFFLTSNAQEIFPDAYSMARGEICTVGSDQGLSIYNPALLGRHQSAAWIAGHSRPFAFREIGVSSLSGILPVDPGNFRLHFTGYGITGYQDLSLEIAYGMKLGEYISAGIGFRYSNTSVTGDWNYLWVAGTGAGLLYDNRTTTRAGIVLLNPVAAGNYSEYGPLSPTMIAAGVSHLIYEHTTVYAECSYNSNTPVQVKFGLDYMISDWFSLACGFHSSPASYSIGAGIKPGNISIHFATGWSAIPGFHPSVLIIWQPKK